ncbi:MAG: hypothetical protein ACSLEZ_08320 [Thiobacillus sp.]
MTRAFQLAPPAARAAVQDFEDGTTQGWTAGGGPLGGVPLAPPTVVSGGAGGAQDDFLQVTSLGGSGPGSTRSTVNPAAWGGDCTDAGLATIGMDLRNFGAADLYIRLLLEDLSDLGDGAALLKSATRLRILGSEFPGRLLAPGLQPPVAATLGERQHHAERVCGWQRGQRRA